MTDHEIARAMMRFGGSFARGLGELWCMADVKNQARLKTAFPEAWREYAELALRQRKQERQERQASR